MKKFIILAALFLLAASCSKQAAPVQSGQTPTPTQVAAASPTPAPTGTQAVPSPTKSPAPTPKMQPTPKSGPVKLYVYTNDSLKFSLNYTSDFTSLTSTQQKSNDNTKLNASACGPDSPTICFVLNGQPYSGTNLQSAAVSVQVLTDKTGVSQCAIFPSNVTTANAIEINGTVFISAVGNDAAAGTFSETHLHRAFVNNKCYEVDETVRWSDPLVFSPPRMLYNRNFVWGQLDLIRGGVHFSK